jgi:hypothetical protein
MHHKFNRSSVAVFTSRGRGRCDLRAAACVGPSHVVSTKPLWHKCGDCTHVELQVGMRGLCV